MKYELPDMLMEHVEAVHRQLDSSLTQITLKNISEVVMVVPKRIIARVGVGDRCIWEKA